MKIEPWQLKQRQSLSLDEKIIFSQRRIEDWYNYWEGQVYVSFSGGKDSTVLLHLVRSLFPEVPAVFLNTGVEYPEILDFIKTIDNVKWIKPKLSFKQVIEKYGYPIISKENAQKLYEIKTSNSEKLKSKRLNGDDNGNGKLSKKWKFLINAPFNISHHCCNVLKKYPAKAYEKITKRKPFIGTMAHDSHLRVMSYYKTGCNSFETARKISKPISIWDNGNIWDYIYKFGLNYSTIYDMGYDNTGCMYCGFGLEKNDKFNLLSETHPNYYNYMMETLKMNKIKRYIENGS